MRGDVRAFGRLTHALYVALSLEAAHEGTSALFGRPAYVLLLCGGLAGRCGRGDACALGLMLGFDEVLSPGIVCDETFAFLDSLLTLGFYEALSLEVMHAEPRVLFGRLACAWLPRGRLT